MDPAAERIVYLNGAFVPESEALIHFRDRGFVYGDAVFDTSRTFGGKIYRLDEHLERLFRSLRYLRIDPSHTPEELQDITHDVVSRIGGDEFIVFLEQMDGIEQVLLVVDRLRSAISVRHAGR